MEFLATVGAGINCKNIAVFLLHSGRLCVIVFVVAECTFVSHRDSLLLYYGFIIAQYRDFVKGNVAQRFGAKIVEIVQIDEILPATPSCGQSKAPDQLRPRAMDK